MNRESLLTALIAILVLTPAAGRADEVPCRPLKWKYARNRTLRDLQQDFAAMPRADLVRSSWTELIENPKDSLAVPMLHYLASTSQRDRLRQYFETIGFLVLPNDQTPSDAIRSWPKKMATKKSRLDLNALCALYKKALDERPGEAR